MACSTVWSNFLRINDFRHLTYSLDEPSSLPALTGLIALAAMGLMIYWFAKKGDEKANDYGQPEA